MTALSPTARLVVVCCALRHFLPANPPTALNRSAFFPPPPAALSTHVLCRRERQLILSCQLLLIASGGGVNRGQRDGMQVEQTGLIISLVPLDQHSISRIAIRSSAAKCTPTMLCPPWCPTTVPCPPFCPRSVRAPPSDVQSGVSARRKRWPSLSDLPAWHLFGCGSCSNR